MNTRYIYNNQIYVITNRAVAANPLFQKKIYCTRFLEKIQQYLGSLCKVISYNIIENQFQLIVKLKSRSSFKNYYIDKRKKMNKDYDKIPHSTYIFSDAMAKLLSSVALHFNWKEKRSGALFASRFKKILIPNQDKLDEWMARFKNSKKIHNYRKKWRQKIKGFRRKTLRKRVRWFHNSNSLNKVNYKNIDKLGILKACCGNTFQGRFNKIQLTTISRKDLLLFLEIRHQIKIKT